MWWLVWMLLLAVVLSRRSFTMRANKSPEPRFDEFQAHGPAQVRLALRGLDDFRQAARETFLPSALLDPEGSVRRLFGVRARVLTALNELRLRLPNDLALETELVRRTETVDRDLLDQIEDARQRCGAPLVHPGPVDDAWYGRWYRGSNDVLA